MRKPFRSSSPQSNGFRVSMSSNLVSRMAAYIWKVAMLFIHAYASAD